MSEYTATVGIASACLLIGLLLGRTVGARRAAVSEEHSDLTDGGKRPWLRIERRAEYDPAPLLTHAALIFVGALIIFVAVIISVQIWKSGEANTESWAALTGLIGWATAQVSTIFSNRFGNTQQSAKKDEVIARQATTAAVIANAASGSSSAVTPAAINPETGNVPAAEVQQPEKGTT